MVKSFIYNRYDSLFVNQVSQQLKDGKEFVGVRICLKISDLELLNAVWVFDFYNDISKEK